MARYHITIFCFYSSFICLTYNGLHSTRAEWNDLSERTILLLRFHLNVHATQHFKSFSNDNMLLLSLSFRFLNSILPPKTVFKVSTQNNKINYLHRLIYRSSFLSTNQTSNILLHTWETNYHLMLNVAIKCSHCSAKRLSMFMDHLNW